MTDGVNRGKVVDMDKVIERLRQFAEAQRPSSWYDDRREAIAAARVAGYSYSVIAAVLGVSKQAVHASQGIEREGNK